MTEHRWVLNALRDLADYAKLNGLKSTKLHLEQSHTAALVELSGENTDQEAIRKLRTLSEKTWH